MAKRIFSKDQEDCIDLLFPKGLKEKYIDFIRQECEVHDFISEAISLKMYPPSPSKSSSTCDFVVTGPSGLDIVVERHDSQETEDRFLARVRKYAALLNEGYKQQNIQERRKDNISKYNQEYHKVNYDTLRFRLSKERKAEIKEAAGKLSLPVAAYVIVAVNEHLIELYEDREPLEFLYYPKSYVQQYLEIGKPPKVNQAALKTLKSLVEKGLLTPHDAAVELGVTDEEFGKL